ncbi:hypothetical protein HU200_056935 [Digitaria exilis]|uniref:Uncharacterized protein n=1 Tax=Digitaria exilis TaxID=1010633 RepID=A0A835E0D0_9POAL|nr:hypothetical protein HU200_056935 [Digitaria exilis]
MTQKQTMFKGQSKKKTVPPNRHGKAPHIRKGKRVVKPTKFTNDMDAEKHSTRLIEILAPAAAACPYFMFSASSSTKELTSSDFFALQELTKFINQCNEIKAANLASKEGGDLHIVKADGDKSKGDQSKSKK